MKSWQLNVHTVDGFNFFSLVYFVALDWLTNYISWVSSSKKEILCKFRYFGHSRVDFNNNWCRNDPEIQFENFSRPISLWWSVKPKKRWFTDFKARFRFSNDFESLKHLSCCAMEMHRFSCYASSFPPLESTLRYH